MNLEEIKSKIIPIGSVRERTLFDIAKFPHRENVISNWYAYFFDAEEEHDLNKLFIQSLLKIVSKKSKKEFNINQFYVCREVITPESKRIDLVIYGTGEDHGKQIIIENKIFFWLHNDLEGYWKHKPTIDEMKVGIVLSLIKEKIPKNLENKFYNILHSELIREIQINVKLEAMSIKQRFYYMDFIQAINNLTKDIVMNEQVQFFFENTDIVNNAVATKKAALDFIFSQIRFAAEELNLTCEGNNERYRWLTSNNEKGVHYTIIVDDLLNSKKSLGIIIELNSDGIKKVEVLDKFLVPKIIASNLKHRTLSKVPFFIHYATRYFDLTTEDLENLGNFITEKIETHYKSIMEDIQSILLK